MLSKESEETRETAEGERGGLRWKKPLRAEFLKVGAFCGRGDAKVGGRERVSKEGGSESVWLRDNQEGECETARVRIKSTTQLSGLLDGGVEEREKNADAMYYGEFRMLKLVRQLQGFLQLLLYFPTTLHLRLVTLSTLGDLLDASSSRRSLLSESQPVHACRKSAWVTCPFV